MFNLPGGFIVSRSMVIARRGTFTLAYQVYRIPLRSHKSAKTIYLVTKYGSISRSRLEHVPAHPFDLEVYAGLLRNSTLHVSKLYPVRGGMRIAKRPPKSKLQENQ